MIFLHQFNSADRLRKKSATLSIVFHLAILLFVAPAAFAREQPADGPNQALASDRISPHANNLEDFSPDEYSKKIHEMAMLDQFLRLPPEKLQLIRQTIEKIESMSPDEKESLRNQLQAFKRLHPRQQEDIRKRFDRIPSEDRAIMRQHWLQMTTEERVAERRKVQQMSPEERHQYHRDIILDARRNQRSKSPPAEGMKEIRNHQETPRSKREGGPFVPPE